MSIPVQIIYPNDNGFLPYPPLYGDVQDPQKEVTFNEEQNEVFEEDPLLDDFPEENFLDEEEEDLEEELEPEPEIDFPTMPERPRKQEVRINIPSQEQDIQRNASFKDCLIDFPEHFMFLGPTKAGKTEGWHNLVNYFDQRYNIAAVYLFSRNYLQEKWLQPDHAYRWPSESKIDEIRATAKVLPSNWYQIIIFDDVLGFNFHNNKYWADLISTARHENICLIFSLQYIKGIPPVVRENLFKYICCSMNNNSVAALFGLSRSENQKEFRKAFNESTLTKGNPMLFNTAPGQFQLKQLSLPRLPASNMPTIGY